MKISPENVSKVLQMVLSPIPDWALKAWWTRFLTYQDPKEKQAIRDFFNECIVDFRPTYDSEQMR